jgi:ABC-type nickel/cobalt efflux system permease component RcnA
MQNFRYSIIPVFQHSKCLNFAQAKFTYHPQIFSFLKVITCHLAVAATAMVLIMVALARPAAAHPMGPESVNHYSGITVHDDGVRIHYIMDIAEIPSYKILKHEIDKNGDWKFSKKEIGSYRPGAIKDLLRGLSLKINGRLVSLQMGKNSVELLESISGPQPAGQKNIIPGTITPEVSILKTIWIQMELIGPFKAKHQKEYVVQYVDNNYSEKKVGWKEVELLESDTAHITKWPELHPLHSGRLKKFPKLTDLSNSPQDTAVRFKYSLGAGANRTPAPASVRRLGLGERIQKTLPQLPELLEGRWFVLTALGLAFLLGCLHALSPGHGKTLVAAYLIGSKGRVIDAVFLGLVVTISHVASIIILGLLIMFAKTNFTSEKFYFWLQGISGLLIVVIGIWMFIRNARGRGPAYVHDHHHHEGHQENNHPTRLLDILVLGITGGIVPCPTALMVLLSAAAINKVSFGLILIGIFSFGIASALIAIGILMVKAKRFMDKRLKESSALRILPCISASIITIIGVVFVLKALNSLGWL